MMVYKLIGFFIVPSLSVSAWFFAIFPAKTLHLALALFCSILIALSSECFSPPHPPNQLRLGSGSLLVSAEMQSLFCGGSYECQTK